MSTTTAHRPDAAPARRLKVGHLVTGIVLLGLALLWLLGNQGLLSGLSLTYLLPLLLIGAGVLGLLALVVNGVRARRTGGAERLDGTHREPDHADRDADDVAHEHDADRAEHDPAEHDLAAYDHPDHHDTDLTAPIHPEEKR